MWNNVFRQKILVFYEGIFFNRYLHIQVTTNTASKSQGQKVLRTTIFYPQLFYWKNILFLNHDFSMYVLRYFVAYYTFLKYTANFEKKTYIFRKRHGISFFFQDEKIFIFACMKYDVNVPSFLTLFGTIFKIKIIIFFILVVSSNFKKLLTLFKSMLLFHMSFQKLLRCLNFL